MAANPKSYRKFVRREVDQKSRMAAERPRIDSDIMMEVETLSEPDSDIDKRVMSDARLDASPYTSQSSSSDTSVRTSAGAPSVEHAGAAPSVRRIGDIPVKTSFMNAGFDHEKQDFDYSMTTFASEVVMVDEGIGDFDEVHPPKCKFPKPKVRQ